MVKVREVEIENKGWIQIVINKVDGYVNGTLLADQIGMSLHGFLKLGDIKESVEHIKLLTGNKEKYEDVSPWDNVKGVYMHPFLALELLAIKKNKDADYRAMDGEDVSFDRTSKNETQEYYNFLKETIFEFLDNNQELKERYSFMVDMFDITCSGARGDCHVK